MTTINWKNGISGNFDTASDWSTGTVPGPSDNVFIEARGTYTVTSSTDETVVALSTASGATLDVTTGEVVAGKGNFSVGNFALGPYGTGLGACTNNGTIEVQADSGLLIADPINNTGTIEAFGSGRFSSSVGDIGLEPYGNSTNHGTINAAGGFIAIWLTGTWWTNPLGFSPTTFVNYGTMEATAQGILDLDGMNTFFGGIDLPFTNEGQLKANNGLIEADAAVNGAGSAIISNGGELDIRHSGFANNISFSGASAGTLGIMFGSWADSGTTGSFTGTLSGFAAGNLIDLYGFTFDANSTLSYSPNHANTGGTLSVTDGTYSTTIQLAGSYSPAGFQISSDGYEFFGGAKITYSPQLALAADLTNAEALLKAGTAVNLNDNHLLVSDIAADLDPGGLNAANGYVLSSVGSYEFINPKNEIGVPNDVADLNQCVALVEGLDHWTQVGTKYWKPNLNEQVDLGATAQNSIGQFNSALEGSIAIGTPIATFAEGKNGWHYTQEHAAIFLGYGTESNSAGVAVPGFFVLDQWIDQPPPTEPRTETAEVRFISFVTDHHAYEYFAIMV